MEFGLGTTTTKLLFKVLSPKGTGLKWESVGQIRPTFGHEVNHAQLADALTRKTEFSEQEWRAFGIRKIHLGDFIRAGATYFSPTLDALPTTHLGELEDICPNGFRLKLPPLSSADQSQSEDPEKEGHVYLLQHAEYLGNNNHSNNITNNLSLSLSLSLSLTHTHTLSLTLPLGDTTSAPALAAAPRPAVPSGVLTGFISTRFS